MLLASFNGHTSEQAILRARVRLQEAQEEGFWDEEMRPIRNMLSRARLKLHDMGLDIVCMFETGYLLIPRRRKRIQ